MYGGGPPINLMWSKVFDPNKPRIHKPIQWRRIIGLFKPWWKDELQVVTCILAISVLGLIPPLFSLWIIDKAIPHHNLMELVTLVSGMVLSAIASAGIGVYQGYINSRIGEGIMRDVRTSLVSHLHQMPLNFFTSTKTGEIINRVTSDVDNIDNVITSTLISILSSIFTIASVVVTIIVLDWRLALLSVLLVPAMIWPLWPVGKRMYDVRKLTRKKRDELSGLTQETLSVSGIVLIKSFVRESFERQRFHDVGTGLMALEVELAMVGRWFLMIMNAMVVIGPATVWLIGGWLAIRHGVTIGIIVTFVTLLTRLYTPASMLASVQVQFISALAVFERIFEYLDMTPEGRDDIDAQSIPIVQGKVEFRQVHFAYTAARQVLNGISLTIQPGEMAAFVGPSGAGKTTICNLVPRFYDPTSGLVLIDGHDTRRMSHASLRKHIGIVTQETYLFNDSIATNLKYARAEATEEEIIAAAKAANIHDFISSLPDGYQTLVGERGYMLSGGERQRLAIARVLLKDPKILILDEATSSLDSENERLIQAALVPLMKGRTCLVIAHRLTTVLAANIVFVIDNGQLVESGTHTELFQRGGLYARLYQHQFQDICSASLSV